MTVFDQVSGYTASSFVAPSYYLSLHYVLCKHLLQQDFCLGAISMSALVPVLQLQRFKDVLT